MHIYIFIYAYIYLYMHIYIYYNIIYIIRPLSSLSVESKPEEHRTIFPKPKSWYSIILGNTHSKEYN